MGTVIGDESDDVIDIDTLIIHTSYNTSPKYCRSGALWSILYIATAFDAKCKNFGDFMYVASGNCPKAQSVVRVRVARIACGF